MNKHELRVLEVRYQLQELVDRYAPPTRYVCRLRVNATISPDYCSIDVGKMFEVWHSKRNGWGKNLCVEFCWDYFQKLIKAFHCFLTKKPKRVRKTKTAVTPQDFNTSGE